MNRRELLLAALGTSLAAGITEAQTLHVDEDEDVIALVLRHPDRISTKAHTLLNTHLKAVFKGTQMENVPVLVLEQGMSLEVVKLPRGEQ